MSDYRLFAFDLDGTLLTSGKEITDRTCAVLQKAHEKGILLVPSTGRFFDGLPTVVRELPFIRYAITINGAVVYDRGEGRELSRTMIPWERAIDVYRFLDDYDLIYDCYDTNGGFMTRAMQERAADYAPNDYYLERIFTWRKPVEDLKAFLTEQEKDVAKIQMFFRDMDLREQLLHELPERFPDLAVATSISNNIEINHAQATKGVALTNMAAALNIPVEATVAFGDDLNDLSMLEAAGCAVAMGNAKEEVKRVADIITKDNDHDGVVCAMEELF